MAANSKYFGRNHELCLSAVSIVDMEEPPGRRFLISCLNDRWFLEQLVERKPPPVARRSPLSRYYLLVLCGASETLSRQRLGHHHSSPQSLCSGLGAGGPAMHGIALRYS